MSHEMLLDLIVLAVGDLHPLCMLDRTTFAKLAMITIQIGMECSLMTILSGTVQTVEQLVPVNVPLQERMMTSSLLRRGNESPNNEDTPVELVELYIH